MAIGKKTGGRAKGTPNKASAERAEAIAATGLTPLDYMLGMLRDDDETKENRMWAAEKAAPYVHPKLAAVEHTGRDGGPIQHAHQLSDEDLAAIATTGSTGVAPQA